MTLPRSRTTTARLSRVAPRVSKTREQAIESLRLSDKQWEQVVSAIRESQNKRTQCRRVHPRSEDMGLASVVLEIKQPGGTKSTLLANGYDLSASGVGVIHGQYLYPGSECTCWLPHASEGMKALVGKARWCRHITGAAHMSGIQFKQIINEFEYIPSKLVA